MAEKNKLPSELDEKIQGLAGDIYLQIEERVADFILANQQTATITAKQIEQHPVYQTLSARVAELVAENATNQKQNDKQHNKNLALIAALEQQNSEYQQTIENSEALNEAKLTDTEATLKVKLNELSALKKQLNTIEKSAASQNEKLHHATVAQAGLTEQLENIGKAKQLLEKNDQAKSATLDVQNKKISELNDQLNTLGAELEQLKTEHKNGLLTASENSNDSQQQLVQLHDEISTISVQFKKEQALSAKLAKQIELDNKELNDSEQQRKALDKKIIELDKANSSHQQLNDEHNAQFQTLTNELSESKSNCQNLEKAIKTLQDANNEGQLNADKNQAQLDKYQHDLESAQQSIADSQKAQANHQQIIGELKATVAQAEITQAKTSKENAQERQALQDKITTLNEEAGQSEQQQNDLIEQLTHSQQQTKLAQQNIDNLTEKQLALVDEITENQALIAQEKQRFIDEHKTNLAEKKQTDDKLIKLNKRLNSGEERQAASAQALIQLQQSYDNLAVSFEQAQRDVEVQTNNVAELEQEISEAKVRNVQAQQRAETNRGKQELEYNKARETIKYLRDENSELNDRLEQQVNELETQLTEYRLRFEYAQKQLKKQ